MLCFVILIISTIIGMLIPKVHFFALFNNIWYIMIYFIYTINVKINNKILNSSKMPQSLKNNSINQMSLITGKAGKSIIIIGCIFIQTFLSAILSYMMIYDEGFSIMIINSDFIINNAMILFIIWNITQIIAIILFIATLFNRMKQDMIK